MATEGVAGQGEEAQDRHREQRSSRCSSAEHNHGGRKGREREAWGCGLKVGDAVEWGRLESALHACSLSL